MWRKGLHRHTAFGGQGVLSGQAALPADFDTTRKFREMITFTESVFRTNSRLMGRRNSGDGGELPSGIQVQAFLRDRLS